MIGGSIGHCTTGSCLTSSGTSIAVSVRVVSTGAFTESSADALSTTSNEGTDSSGGKGVNGIKGVSSTSVRATSPPDGRTSNDPDASGALVTFGASALLLRARLTPARSVQRAAFSAMLRSVSCTLGGGVTFCVVGIGRVKLGGARRVADAGMSSPERGAAGKACRGAAARLTEAAGAEVPWAATDGRPAPVVVLPTDPAVECEAAPGTPRAVAVACVDV
jgi:hypothetical protein